MRAQVLYDLDRMNIPIKIIGMMKDSMGNAVQAFAYESDHVPVAGDVIAHDDVKYVVNRRFWVISGNIAKELGKKTVLLEVDWA